MVVRIEKKSLKKITNFLCFVHFSLLYSLFVYVVFRYENDKNLKKKRYAIIDNVFWSIADNT